MLRPVSRRHSTRVAPASGAIGLRCVTERFASGGIPPLGRESGRRSRGFVAAIRDQMSFDALRSDRAVRDRMVDAPSRARGTAWPERASLSAVRANTHQPLVSLVER